MFQRIAKKLQRYQKCGAEIPFIRPKNLSGDKASSADAIKHALLASEKVLKKFDYVVELMATNPLKTVEDIDSVLNILVKKKTKSVIAVHQLFDHHPARIKIIKKNKLCDFVVKEKLESLEDKILDQMRI